MYNYNPYQRMNNPLTGANHLPRNIPNTRNASRILGNAGTGIKGPGLASINWSNLFSNSQKVLGFINQTLPVYNQVKPVVNNARSMLRMMKAIKEPVPSNKQPIRNNTKYSTIPVESKIAINKSSPTFFK